MISQDHKYYLRTTLNQDKNHQSHKKAQNLILKNKKHMGIITNQKNHKIKLGSLNLQLKGMKRRKMKYHHKSKIKNQFHLLKDNK